MTAFQLPPLPYAIDSLEPHVSAEALEIHYEKHHRGYVDTLNEIVDDSEMAEIPLEKLIEIAASHDEMVDLFNAAAQVWNHTFFWRSMRPVGGGPPPDSVAQALADSFRGLEGFKRQFRDQALSVFGSGWVWLVDDDGDLAVETTSNAHPPFVDGRRPLLTCDVWEHAYYVDYRNERAGFVDAFLEHLINWDFLAENLSAAS